jgi:hypothetical protein
LGSAKKAATELLEVTRQVLAVATESNRARWACSAALKELPELLQLLIDILCVVFASFGESKVSVKLVSSVKPLSSDATSKAKSRRSSRRQICFSTFLNFVSLRAARRKKMTLQPEVNDCMRASLMACLGARRGTSTHAKGSLRGGCGKSRRLSSNSSRPCPNLASRRRDAATHKTCRT